jgi:hypothetical protein
LDPLFFTVLFSSSEAAKEGTTACYEENRRKTAHSLNLPAYWFVSVFDIAGSG